MRRRRVRVQLNACAEGGPRDYADPMSFAAGARRMGERWCRLSRGSAGGYFLVHHVDVTVGDEEVRAIEVIEEPASEGDGILARSFDHQGNAEVMRVTVDDEGVFHFTGGPAVAAAGQPADATTARVRSTLSVASDRRSMTALWERSEDGHSGEPWVNITFTRRP